MRSPVGHGKRIRQDGIRTRSPATHLNYLFVRGNWDTTHGSFTLHSHQLNFAQGDSDMSASERKLEYINQSLLPPPSLSLPSTFHQPYFLLQLSTTLHLPIHSPTYSPTSKMLSMINLAVFSLAGTALALPTNPDPTFPTTTGPTFPTNKTCGEVNIFYTYVPRPLALETRTNPLTQRTAASQRTIPT